MKRNVGSGDRVARLAVAAALAACAIYAPLSLFVRISALLVPAVYLAFTSLAGTCFGYRMMGMSTCPR